MSYNLVFSHGVDEVYIENKGQWNSNILFNKLLPYGNFYLEKDGFTYFLYDKSYVQELHHNKKAKRPEFIQAHTIKTKFLNYNQEVKISKRDKSLFYNNYLLGNNKSKWQSYVYSYGEVVYDDLYNNIDLKVYQTEEYTKYDFIVSPGGNTNNIKIEYSGQDAIFIENGNLYVGNTVNDIIEQRPYAYQVINGKKKKIACEYVLDKNVLAYNFPNGYNEALDLVIDPVIVFASYTGSTADNFGFTATYDDAENAYVGGIVFATNQYPVTPGAFQMNFNTGFGVDMGISKFSSDGSSLLYSTYIGGGTSSDAPHSLVVNDNNELFILGTTGSTDFPFTPTAFDTTFNGGVGGGPLFSGVSYQNGADIVVVKLNATGTGLLGSTYVGGSANDGLNTSSLLSYNYGDGFRGEIIIDPQGNCIVATTTNSIDFPIDTLTASQPKYGGGYSDGVSFKLDRNLSNMIWGTFIGGTNADAAYGTQFDSGGDIYVTGGTLSSDFITTSTAVDTTYNGFEDGFVTRYNITSNSIVASTYLGTGAYDQCYFVQLDVNDNVYLAGQSTGNYPIIGNVYNNPNSGQFIHKMSNTFDTTYWSTQVGSGRGTVDISPSAFLVNNCGFVYLSGWGGSVNNFYRANASSTNGMPLTADAYQSTTDGSDFYLMVLNNDAANLLYGTFFGGPVSAEHVDGGTSRFDKKGNVYQSVCAGCGSNSDFPSTPGAWSPTNNSFNCNLGVFKFNLEYIQPIASAPVPFICLPDSVSFQNNSSGGNTYKWYFGDGDSSTSFSPNHVYSDTGSYMVTLIVSDSTGCMPPDTADLIIDVYRPKLITIQPVDTICVGDTVQIDAIGGQTFKWTPSATLVNDTVEDPFAFPSVTTTYQLISTHYCNSDTGWITVPVQTQSLSIDPDTTICPESSIQLSAYGCVSYTWSPLIGLVNGNTASPTFSPLIPMYYYVEGITNLGCVFRDSIYIDIYQDSMSIIKDTFMCVNDSIILFATGGGSYSWNPSTNLSNPLIANPIASPLATTTFTVDVISPNGCPLRESMRLVVHDDPHTISLNTSICLGDSTQLLSSGGGSYSWNPSNSLNNSNISNPIAAPITTTKYSLDIISPNGCLIEDTVVVTVLNDPIWVSNDTSICLGNNANLNAGGGITYSWSPAIGLSNIAINNPIATPLISTLYYVSVTTADGCIKTDSVFVFVDTNIPNPGLTDDLTICYGDTVSLTATGANNYSWSPSIGLSNPNGNITFAYPSSTTTYIVSYSNACALLYDTITINVNKIEASISPNVTICKGESVFLSAFGGTIYRWNNDISILTKLDSSTIIVKPVVPTIYYVQVEDTLGCSQLLSVIVNFYPDPIINAGPDVVITYGGQTTLNSNGSIGNIVWSPSDSLSCTMCPNPIASPLNNKTYVVTLTDSNGCVAYDSLRVLIDGILYVPNSFTPDGDGKNDLFFARGENIAEFKIWVFNRWGQLIFETDDINKGWDGYFKGVLSKTDTYVWRIKYSREFKKGIEVIGHVNLLR